MRSSAKRSSPSSINPPAATLARQIEMQLRARRNPTRAAGEKAYLKSEFDFLGVDLPTMRRIVQGIKGEYPQLDRGTLLALVNRLWSVPVFERRMTALLLLEASYPLLTAADIKLVERLIRQSRTWALVDDLAIAAAGPLVERHLELVGVLDRWAGDDDFWIRRSAMLALLRPLRKGAGDFARFARYADAMLEEREFFIRKAIGWVLRETGHKRPDLVYRWLLPRCSRASGVTVREAVRWLTPAQRETCVAAYRSATGRTVTSFREPR